jgi:signal transduction histidine kinase
MEQGIVAGLAAYRWAAWAWMGAVLLLSREELVNAPLAYVLVALALAVTIASTAAVRAGSAPLRTSLVGTELACGAALVAGDGWVYGAGHAFSPAQSLGVAWPLAGVLASGVAGGPWAGLAAGVVLGGARALGAIGNGVRDFDGERALSLMTTGVLFAMAGTVAGHVTRLLRRAEREISAARAREELARTLHDGVLQTLTVIERRSDDAVLAKMAREQGASLRDYIAGLRASPDPDLESALRAAATRYEESFGGRVQLVVADDLPPPKDRRASALAGAVGEALTNAGKHGSASSVTVFVEPGPDGGVFCAIKDDGIGFEPSSTNEGLGISRSIRERLDEVGGRVEIESRAGGPTEVRMWVP